MTAPLLPANFEEMIRQAVQVFWQSRSKRSPKQPGSRSSVIDGKNLDGFLEVARAVATHCGFHAQAVLTRSRSSKTIPGYFRPTKIWDTLILHDDRLIAALEYKSIIGSLGNNLNNRSEEVVGNATDFWTALKMGAFESEAASARGSSARPPFLGYLMLLEDSVASTRPVKITSPHFRPSPAFLGASYADRFSILCERLMSERLYDAAALLLSPEAEGARAGV